MITNHGPGTEPAQKLTRIAVPAWKLGHGQVAMADEWGLRKLTAQTRFTSTILR
jgi:hypothetical protein